MMPPRRRRTRWRVDSWGRGGVLEGGLEFGVGGGGE